MPYDDSLVSSDLRSETQEGNLMHPPEGDVILPSLIRQEDGELATLLSSVDLGNFLRICLSAEINLLYMNQPYLVVTVPR